MPEKHYENYKKEISERDKELRIANEKKSKKKLPVIKNLEDWLAQRHEKKAARHEARAFEHINKHVEALEHKHKL